MFAFATYPRSRAFKRAGNSVARPWVSKLSELTFSVADYGGSPLKDNSIAIARTYAAIKRRGSGGILSFPGGGWPFSSFPAIDSSSVIVQGGGCGNSTGTVLQPTSTTGDDIVFSGQFCSIEDITIRPTVRKTSGYAIRFDTGTFQSTYRNLFLTNVYNGILFANGSELQGQDAHCRFLLGTNGLTISGTAANGVFGGTFDRLVCDNPYPGGPVKTWAQSTAFSVNDIILNNGRVYFCAVAGTSAGVGTGPSGLPPGSTAQDAFTNTIADGTVQWRFASDTLTWVRVDNYSYSLRFNNTSVINGVNGFVMTDTANLGAASRPKWMFVNNLETDHTFNNGVQLDFGSDFNAINSWLGSSLTAHGLSVGSTFVGNIGVEQTRMAGNRQNGALVQAGPKGVILRGNYFQHNSQAGSGLFHGVNFGAGATDFIIQANQSGPDPELGGGNAQGWGVFVNSGASDRYIIADNLVSGNVTGGVNDGGSGSNKRVANNY